ncbi:hypothetical protein LPJ77_006597, partial [Coemansia sp. RSA 2523]
MAATFVWTTRLLAPTTVEDVVEDAAASAVDVVVEDVAVDSVAAVVEDVAEEDVSTRTTKR